MRAITVGRHVARRDEAGLAERDEVTHQRAEQTADHLSDPISRQHFPFHAASQRRTQRDRGVEMPTGDSPERVHAGQYGQTERERDTEITDAEREEIRLGLQRKDRAANAAEHQPKGAESLRSQFVEEIWS